MAHWSPQEVALNAFLRYLSETVHGGEPVILVLRGSLLLRHWFAESARPAADIDLECFERVRGRRGNRFTSLIDHCRGLCCFATERAAWANRGAAPVVEFDENAVPEDGQSLWDYGTPGQRFHAGWTWHGPEERTGRIQIDLAESGSYDLNEIGVTDVPLVSLDGSTFRFPCYAPETMLATKLSWLLRSFGRLNPGGSDLEWKGDPKDLYDLHLLLTKTNLRVNVFQKALMAIGREDRLDWNNLQALFDVDRAEMTDADFRNWDEFREQHKDLVPSGPVELLWTIADRLGPLLGDFYLPKEMPFLLAINAHPLDEAGFLIYADWLEERGEEPRSHFLRLCSRLFFRAEQLSRKELARTRTALQATLRITSVPWLLQLFGTSARWKEMRQHIEG
ncbi:MAG TPA: nucleotidyl transferase AbiEii/AbiGii toxin family protein [Gemmataceae bacterium]|nr:nucleotidyl transferase AbiEii/AbiGii toxin family protein [Gemmataceae bacterium]